MTGGCKKRRTLKVERCRQTAMNRTEWTSVVKEVKVLRGTRYQGVVESIVK